MDLCKPLNMKCLFRLGTNGTGLYIGRWYAISYSGLYMGIRDINAPFADTSFRLYVGIKQSGAFQHSSFLHGARISAAGLIKVKDGQLRSLAPLRYSSTALVMIS